jgi:hypothetical protein
MSKNTNIDPGLTKVITGEVRLSYANVWEPKSIDGSKPKYSVSVIVPKKDVRTIAKIKAAVEAAYVEGESKLKGKDKKVPSLSSIKTPLRDGDIDRPEDEAYADSYFVNANSNTPPEIVDRSREPITDHDEVYSGVYARVSMNFYAFNSNGNKGIACGLLNIQKLRNGPRLGGKSKAEDDFDDDFVDSYVYYEDDDFLN